MSVHEKITKLIRRTLLHTLKEWDAVATRDNSLKNILSHDEGRLRGLKLTNLQLEPSHFKPVENDFELHLTHDYSTVSTARAFRKGQLIELSLADTVDKEEWTKVNGIISEVKGQSIYLQTSKLGDNFLLHNLSKNSPTIVNLSQRSTKPIIETSAKALKNLKLNRFNYRVSKSIVDPDNQIPDQYTKQDQKSQPIFMQEDFLDQDKIQAVNLCCECHPLTIIHGPPGTGKTTGLAAVILSELANGSRILAVAPSHAAVDALTMALLKQWNENVLKLPKSKLIRIGNPLRLRDENVLPYLPKLHDQSQCVLEELHEVWTSLINSDKGAKKMLIKEESELLRKSQKSRRSEMFSQIKHCSVVTSTCLTALAWKKEILRRFDIICIDEAAFAPDWLTLPLVLSGVPRVILSGDHFQLPPVVTFQSSITSLMERCIHKVPTSTLNQQFRSNEIISNWSSKHFYQGQLKAHANVKDTNLNDLVEKPIEMLGKSLVFVDTSDSNYFEDCKGEFEGSYSNLNEAYIVEDIVKEYVDKGINPEDIGIISPYWSQVALLRDLLIDLPLTISTVDGFQGCEKELIIISFVRSNLEQRVGFLEEVRRINVSITRAKRCCIVIGDISTLSADSGLKSFVDYCVEKNVVVKADDYVEQSLIV